MFQLLFLLFLEYRFSRQLRNCGKHICSLKEYRYQSSRTTEHCFQCTHGNIGLFSYFDLFHTAIRHELAFAESNRLIVST